MRIRSLMIANRGEILRRIAVTAKQLDMETVSIWQDKVPPSTSLSAVVDRFVEIKDSPNAYLDQEKLLAATIASGCDAIHPGFGFLSENAAFARKIVEAGIIWVGPHPESMLAMASKDTSRRIAQESGVPVNHALQGFLPSQDGSHLQAAKKFGSEIGYPLLVKAAMGGGGKGMRLVDTEGDLDEAINRAHSEATSSFGDGTLLIEKFINSPRHVEVQVLADKHGNAFAIGDRDCSIQRRHQKIVEEAPAPDLLGETREQMHAAAVALAKKVGYDSAGTVEFLVDASDTKFQPFFFLEMNTRLQVEHPVTEEVFGIDLVRWQLDIACNMPLPELSAIQPRGHAVEVRLYAEDSMNRYLPSPGPVYDFRPFYGPGIRWETDLDHCGFVSERYDPMIAKVIALAENREAALCKLADSLKRTSLLGTTTNLDYLVAILEHQNFRTGAVTTKFLSEHHSQLAEKIQTERETHSHTFAKVHALAAEGQNDEKQARNSNPTARALAVFGKSPQTPVSRPVILRPQSYPFQKGWIKRGVWRGAEEGPVFFCIYSDIDGTEFWATKDGSIYTLKSLASSLNTYLTENQNDIMVAAPVPGKVIQVLAEPEQDVNEGEVVVILESMKLEFEIRAERNGKIENIHVKTGDQVSAGDSLVSWHVD